MDVPGRSGARAEPYFAVWSVALYSGVIVTSIKWDILFYSCGERHWLFSFFDSHFILFFVQNKLIVNYDPEVILIEAVLKPFSLILYLEN